MTLLDIAWPLGIWSAPPKCEGSGIATSLWITKSFMRMEVLTLKVNFLLVQKCCFRCSITKQLWERQVHLSVSQVIEPHLCVLYFCLFFFLPFHAVLIQLLIKDLLCSGSLGKLLSQLLQHIPKKKYVLMLRTCEVQVIRVSFGREPVKGVN